MILQRLQILYLEFEKLMKTQTEQINTTNTFKYLFTIITLTLSILSVEVDKEEGVAIGIDLGTTYCAFSYFDPKINKIVMLTDEHGNETIPSVLFYDKQNGKMLVGREAKDMLGDAENKVYDAKRIIGRKFKEKVVQNDLSRWPFKLQSGPNDSPVFKPNLTKTEMEVFKKKVNKMGVMMPEEISATILQYLKNNAERILDKTVTKAVITVPAYFNTQQRQATKDAGEMAGLNVLRVINEPTSAAIAFGLDEKKQDGGKSLIFDLGGGTFDVSIVEIDGGFFDVKSSHGDAHLGGQDFDKYLSDLYLKKAGYKSTDLSKNELNKLKLEAEKVKIELSKKTDAKFEMTIKGQEKAVRITRVEFEKVLEKKIKKKLERTMDKALKGAGIKKENILNLVMIGGSTRIPSVRNMVKKHMNIEPYIKIDPDKAVAYGAGIQAAILSGVKTDKLEDVILLDVTPLDLGIETQGGIMATIIKMNEKIPIKRKQTFMPASQSQESVVIAIYQGPNKMARKNNFLGKFDLKGIGKNFPEIDVEFEVDANGIVKVVAHEKGNDTKGEIVLDKASTISEEEKERIIQEFKENEEQDKLEADITSTKQSIISQATRLVNENPNEELKSKVNEILNEVNVITEFDEDNLKKIKEIEAKFTSILQMAGGAAGGQSGASGDSNGDDDEDEDDDEDL